MMDEGISILPSKKNKVQDPDEAFGMTIGASLRSISKILEIIFQAQLRKPMALFAPNNMTQTLPITHPTAGHKKTRLFRIFHIHKQIS